MELQKFKEAIEAIKSYDEFCDNLYDLKIDILNTDGEMAFSKLKDVLFTTEYTEEGLQWVDWYLYEKPNFDKMIELHGDKKEYHAWDENGNPLVLDTDEDLWNLLETDYGKHN